MFPSSCPTRWPWVSCLVLQKVTALVRQHPPSLWSQVMACSFCLFCPGVVTIVMLLLVFLVLLSLPTPLQVFSVFIKVS